jgi:DNA-binding IclR family transcriptional regulator
MSTQLSHALARIKVLDVGHEKLEEYIKEVRLEAHNAALEQAAKVCKELRHPNWSDEDHAWIMGTEACAAAIRAMKVEK